MLRCHECRDVGCPVCPITDLPSILDQRVTQCLERIERDPDQIKYWITLAILQTLFEVNYASA